MDINFAVVFCFQHSLTDVSDVRGIMSSISCVCVCVWLYGSTTFYTPFIFRFLSVFSAIQEVMRIWEKNKSFLCYDKPLPRKWGGPKQTAVKLAWSEVYRIPNVAMGRGIVAAMKPVWNSLIRLGTHWKKWTIQNRDGYGGWGQELTLLLCNQGELQTLNVEWQSHGAAVYQRCKNCVQLTNIYCKSRSQGSDFLCKEGRVLWMPEQYLKVISDDIPKHLVTTSSAPSSDFTMTQ